MKHFLHATHVYVLNPRRHRGVDATPATVLEAVEAAASGERGLGHTRSSPIASGPPVWFERRLGPLVVEVVNEQPHHLQGPVGAAFRRRHHPGVARVQRVIVEVLQVPVGGRARQLEAPVVARDEPAGQRGEPLRYPLLRLVTGWRHQERERLPLRGRHLRAALARQHLRPVSSVSPSSIVSIYRCPGASVSASTSALTDPANRFGRGGGGGGKFWPRGPNLPPFSTFSVNLGHFIWMLLNFDIFCIFI